MVTSFFSGWIASSCQREGFELRSAYLYAGKLYIFNQIVYSREYLRHLQHPRTAVSPDFNSLQHLDYEPVHTERPGELIAYYKIARKESVSLLLSIY